MTPHRVVLVAMLVAVLPVSQVPTLPTGPSSVEHVGVVRRHVVSLAANRERGPVSGRTTLDVDRVRHGFKVPRIHTPTIPAKVVQLQPDWHFAAKHSIGDAVDTALNASAVGSPPAGGVSVPLRIDSARPNPAGLTAQLCGEPCEPFPQGNLLKSHERNITIFAIIAPGRKTDPVGFDLKGFRKMVAL